MRHRFPCLLLLSSLAALPASGAVLFETTTTDPAGETVRSGRVWIEGDVVRIDLDADQSVLFSGREMVVMDHDERWALPLDEESVAGLGSQMDAMKAQMDAALEKLPADQRDAYRKILADQMGGGAATETDPVRLEPGDMSEAGGITCRTWSVRRGETLDQELCVADTGDVEGAAAALGAIRSMAGFFEDLVGNLQSVFPGAADHPALRGNPFAQLEKVDGFPVAVTVFEGGAPSETTLILPAGSADAPEGAFDPRPAGYAVRSLGGGGR